MKKSNKITCFFPIETKVRDLDSRLLTALEIINDDHDCFIGSKTSVLNNLKYFPTPIIFDKGLSEDYFFYNDLKRLGVQFIVLGEESGIFRQENFFPNLISQYPRKVLPLCFASLEWGNIQTNWVNQYIKKNFGIKNFKFLVTGNPRFDLLKEKFKPFFHQREQSIKKKYKKFVLINTNFTQGNDLRGGRGFLFHLDKKGNDILFNYFHDLILKYIEVIKYLSKNIEGYNFVIRPHPTEGREIYENAFKNYKNIFVDDCSRNVHDLIFSSELLIHHDCTTAIEAYIAKKDIISYHPIDDDNFKFFEKSFIYQLLPIDLSTKVSTKDDLLRITKKFLNNKNNDHSKIDIIKEWIKNASSHNYAYIDIAKFVHESSSELKNYYIDTIEKNIKFIKNYNINSIKNKLLRNINFFIFFGSDHNKTMGYYLKSKLIFRDFIKPLFRKYLYSKKPLANKKITEISFDEINNSLYKFSKINEKYNQIIIKKICENGFYIYKKD